MTDLKSYQTKAREALKDLLYDYGTASSLADSENTNEFRLRESNALRAIEGKIDTLLSDFLDELEKVVPKHDKNEEILGLQPEDDMWHSGFASCREQTLQAFKTFREGDGNV